MATLDKVTKAHLACTYASLILHDEGLAVNNTKILDLIAAAGVTDIDRFYAKLYANTLNNATIESAIASGGAGGSSVSVAAGAAPAGGSAPAAVEAKKEEKKQPGRKIF